jgi:pyrroline-5-carboxylate reductase
MTKTVLLAGCGNMGFAMLKGWIAGGAIAPDDVAVVEPNEALRIRAAGLGVKTFAEVADAHLPHNPDVIVIAVKPQVMAAVLHGYKSFAERGSTFVSIAAGIGSQMFSDSLGLSTPVIRCMPNTPAAIGKGMLVYYQNESVSADTEDFVRSLLSKSGRVAKVEREELIDAVTAVSGSGPAYVFHFIECLTEAGVEAGLPRDISGELAMQTVMGAGALAAQSADSPATLREQVTSPKGTTAAALDVLMDGGRMQLLVSEAVAAAHRRAIELGS